MTKNKKTSMKLYTQEVCLDSDVHNLSSDLSTRAMGQSLSLILLMDSQMITRAEKIVSITPLLMEQTVLIFTLSMMLPVIPMTGLLLPVKLSHHHVIQHNTVGHAKQSVIRHYYALMAISKSMTSATRFMKKLCPMMMLYIHVLKMGPHW